ncbi:MAG TPA: Rieske (2Fe-2S) protein [Actinocrinis sp.]|uniref:Rieske (2Fe-2S) protein n=1 Tax=Actinocrinis sp. TaxID=1920516 RepID=UPI002DDD320D|nr:Rieske (2Fe-2S) protein [Actinocrinis sp.]HEV2346973.1 Rieske (2Fe-2S) protein [Actinocrinis sp.]
MTLEVTQHQAADETEANHGSSRRTVLRVAGVGGAVVAAGLTAAACSSSSSNNASSGDTPASSAPAGGGSSPSASSSSSGSGGGALAQTSDVPVDGGTVVTADGGTVITQPAAGTYKAFTAICTHQGCTVGSVSNNQIMCPCHGSIYSAKDGSVVQGPAPSPLAAKQITVSGGQIFLAS